MTYSKILFCRVAYVADNLGQRLRSMRCSAPMRVVKRVVDFRQIFFYETLLRVERNGVERNRARSGGISLPLRSCLGRAGGSGFFS